MQLGYTLGLNTPSSGSGLTALNLVAPTLGDAPIGQPVSIDLGVWEPGTNLTADLLRDGAVIQTGLDGSDITFTPADDEASFVLRVTGTPADGGVPLAVVTAPVTARYAPPAVVEAQVPQIPEIYDENTGPQTLDLGPAFAGEALSFTVTGLNAATINSTTGVLTTGTNVPISSGQVTVVAQNSGGSAAITVDIIVEDDGDTTLTPTAMQTSVTDPITGHVYSFVAADGVTPEAREVGQYQDGTWFVLGEPGDEVRIGSITPVSTSVSTAAYGVPDNLDDTATVGAQTRWLHGAMVNPWQGVGPGQGSKAGFDNYYASSNPGASVSYLHSLNVDPGAAGVLTLAEGSIVKAESLLDEGLHGANPSGNKTRVLHFSCLTVAPEIPAANSFRPPIRGTDKRSYWTADQLDISGNRQNLIAGLSQYDQSQVDASYDKIKYIQNTFMPFQEQALRWNPGARNGGVGIYGDDWYGEFARTFATFHSADFTDAELEPIIKATVQVGIDIYGLMQDGSHYHAWQAHHAGRKGIVMMAGLLLDDQNILDLCDYNLHPDHFGVDDAYCGYVTQNMVGIRGGYYKGAHPYEWEDEHVGQPEWSGAFTRGGTPTAPDKVDQIADPDLPRRSYQVLSFDNGAMFQCLWGMIMDPTARYYKPAYFDFADRYLGVRFGDQIDRVWDASSNNDGTNGHFTGNWHSINPRDEAVGYMKLMRDAAARPDYITQLQPEPLPKPQVTRNGSDAFLTIDFNVNNFRMPQDKDVAITGYDLRWTAYAGGADTVSGEDQPEYIGNFEWNVIENVTIPYQLSGVPRGLKAKIQLRMKNANGPGPWMDDRKRENFAPGSTSFSALAGTQRYSTNFDVPDEAAFDQPPMNFGAPLATPALGAVTGSVATGHEGIWSENPATTNTEWKWQISDDGVTGWADIPGATASTFTTTAAQEGRFLRPGVRKTNSIGASAYIYANAGLSVSPPVAIELNAGNPGESAFDAGAGALGGKRLAIMFASFNGDPISVGGNIGAYSFGAAEVLYEDNTGTSGQSRQRQVMYQVEVPAGETAETITFNHVHVANTVAAYELTTPMQLTQAHAPSSGATRTVDTVAGGAAFWMARGSQVNFVSSTTLVAHTNNPPADSSWAFAHALGIGTGSISVVHSNAFDSNTQVALVSLEPAL